MNYTHCIILMNYTHCIILMNYTHCIILKNYTHCIILWQSCYLLPPMGIGCERHIQAVLCNTFRQITPFALHSGSGVICCLPRPAGVTACELFGSYPRFLRRGIQTWKPCPELQFSWWGITERVQEMGFLRLLLFLFCGGGGGGHWNAIGLRKNIQPQPAITMDTTFYPEKTQQKPRCDTVPLIIQEG
jgi:hypothetical protein